MQRKRLSTNKGSSLVSVILMITVLILLGSVLITSALQNFKTSKSEGYIDYAYYAADSVIEKCIDNIYQICMPSTFTSGLSYIKTNTQDNSADFAKSVVDKINNDANLKKVYTGIDVSDDASHKATAKVSIKYISYRYRTGAPGKMIITIGITANATYNNPIYGGGSKEAFAQREFEVYLPHVFKLDAAIKSIGDLFVEKITATIHGGVNVYGTSPERANQMEQYYYGGICARDHAVLNIMDGNTYTRSFIRTGLYGGAEGGSEIHVGQDAVAQCIQAFGYDDVIAVYRNAYTFDDIEMNAENSVIAVNGNYFGLSKGGMHHDESSAIVNSATVYFSNSDESKKSRIVINGDVMLGGGTFRIDPLGVIPPYQIEDASIAWSSFMQMPTYKLYDYSEEYKYWIRKQNDAHGFGNLFQVWDIVTDFSKIENWVNDVKNARFLPDFTDPAHPKYNIVDTSKVGSVSGFCNYSMAANDTMYFMDEADESNSSVKQAKNSLGFFPMDGIDYSQVQGGTWAGYKGKVYTLLDSMKSTLLPITEDLVARDLAKDPTAHNPAASPYELSTSTNKETLFKCLQTKLNEFDENANTHIIKVPVGVTTFNINGYISSKNLPTGSGDYYLVINNYPERDVEVTGSFKGIIFTMGRVIVRTGADINGAIVAAGRGFTNSGSYVAGSAADSDTGDSIPRVMEHGENLQQLNDGEYAAVIIEGSNNTEQAQITFPGRDALVQAFEKLGIDLNSIFY